MGEGQLLIVELIKLALKGRNIVAKQRNLIARLDETGPQTRIFNFQAFDRAQIALERSVELVKGNFKLFELINFILCAEKKQAERLVFLAKTLNRIKS